MPKKVKRTNPDRLREITVALERSAINEEDRSVSLSFSSETPVVVWGESEILEHSAEAVDLTRLREIGVALFNHNRDYVLGPVSDVSIDETERKGHAVIKFDDDPEADKIFRKVLSGTLKGVSVRARVHNWEYVEKGAKSTCGRFDGPSWIARKWEPMEISIVSLPADASVGVGRSEDDEDDMNMKRSGNVMPKNNVKQQTEDPIVTRTEGQNEVTANPQPSPPAPDANAIREQAAAQERQRCADITALCRQFGLEPDEHIEAGRSVDQVRQFVLDKLGTERAAVPTATVTVDERDKFRSAVTDGLSVRAGLSIEKPASGHDSYRGLRLLDIARECVARSGDNQRYTSDDELIRAAISGTSDFPLILSNVAHKSMALAYQAAPTSFEQWTRKGTVSDFKPHTRYRLSEADELVEMSEHGEFTHSEIGEADQTVQAGTYGRSFSITRKALINDDLNALSTIPAKYGVAAKRMINRMVYDLINNNVKIGSTNLFHSNHGNLASAGGVLSVETLGAGRAAMRKQKNIGKKEYLNITPAFLLVPTDLETAAQQLVASIVDPSKNNATPNPFANRLTVIADPHLDDGSTAAWYLAAAPGLVDTVEVVYLHGKEMPTMESMTSFDMLGIKWRIYFDFGVKALDYRGLYKNPGPSAGGE